MKPYDFKVSSTPTFQYSNTPTRLLREKNNVQIKSFDKIQKP